MRELSRLGRLVVCVGLAAGCAASSETKAPPSASQPAAPAAAQPATQPTSPAATQPATPPATQPATQPTSPAATPQPAARAATPPAAQPATQPTSPAATPPAAQPATSTSGVALREEKDFGQVWLAPGFDFKGYDVLLVTEPRAEVPKLNPDGIQNLEWARGVLRTELAAALQERKLFTVVQAPADVKPGNRLLRLDSTIIEYEKGGGGARYFAGIYGAGHPVIKVRGQLTADGRPLFVYEARRSSVSTTARIFGGYRGDKAIQEEDIKDLAKGLGDFIAKTKGP